MYFLYGPLGLSVAFRYRTLRSNLQRSLSQGISPQTPPTSDRSFFIFAQYAPGQHATGNTSLTILNHRGKSPAFCAYLLWSTDHNGTNRRPIEMPFRQRVKVPRNGVRRLLADCDSPRPCVLRLSSPSHLLQPFAPEKAI